MSIQIKQRCSKTVRRRQMIAIAHRLVRKEGADAITLNEVAQAAGVTKPIAYRLFGSKNLLLIHLFIELEQQRRNVIEKVVTASYDNARALAQAFSEHCIEYHLARANEQQILYYQLQQEPSNAELIQGYNQQRAGELRSAFSQFVHLPERTAWPYFIGLIGASDKLIEQVIDGNLSTAAAITAHAQLILCTLRCTSKSFESCDTR